MAQARNVRLFGESRKKDDRLDAQTWRGWRESIPSCNTVRGLAKSSGSGYRACILVVAAATLATRILTYKPDSLR